MECTLQRRSEGVQRINCSAGKGQVFHSPRSRNERAAIAAKQCVETKDTMSQRMALSLTPLPEFLEDFCRYLSARRTRKVVFRGTFRAPCVFRADLPRAPASDARECAMPER